MVSPAPSNQTFDCQRVGFVSAPLKAKLHAEISSLVVVWLLPLGGDKDEPTGPVTQVFYVLQFIHLELQGTT